MNCLFLLLDVRVDPVNPYSSGAALFALLAIVFLLAVGFTFGLVALLIWFKRRKRAVVSDQGTVVSDQLEKSDGRQSQGPLTTDH